MSKLSVKHFELLTKGTQGSWNNTFKQKMQKNVFITFTEKWKKKE